MLAYFTLYHVCRLRTVQPQTEGVLERRTWLFVSLLMAGKRARDTQKISHLLGRFRNICIVQIAEYTHKSLDLSCHIYFFVPLLKMQEF